MTKQMQIPKELEQAAAALEEVIGALGSVAVAVSGGIDSLVLSAVCMRLWQQERISHCQLFHAISPAVSTAATARLEECAIRFAWPLRIIDAAEFANEQYLSNPVNRCYFCKSSLYSTIAQCTKSIIVSGTNLDDMSDYRPGLEAAKAFLVRHPFVESGIGKSTIRQFAVLYELEHLADLPASPCLSSRVETGISIDASELRSIELVESMIAERIRCRTVRCRLRANGVHIEVDEDALALIQNDLGELQAEVSRLLAGRYIGAAISFTTYSMGSAFLRELA